MSTEVIFTAMVGIIFLNDPTTLQFWIGGAMVIGSGLMLNRGKAAHENNQSKIRIP